MDNRTWFEEMPKVELHLHLEGAIPLPALFELMGKYGGDESVQTLQDLERKFQFRDFPHFIENWIWKSQFIRDYDDISFYAEAVATDLAAQNIVYCEAFYTAQNQMMTSGLSYYGITEAVRKGLDKVPGIHVNLLADMGRDLGPDRAEEILPLIHEARELGILGGGIGGSEQAFPPQPFRKFFEDARNLGLRTTAHAGEAAGADSVWGAVRELQVERIGHGTRAVEDDDLVEYLCETKIPIDLCPISNLRTGAVASLQEHPVRRYFDQGLVLSINTDDPKMFHNSLADEYQSLAEVHSFTNDEIKALTLTAVQSSFLSDSEKERLRDQLTSHPVWSLA